MTLQLHNTLSKKTEKFTPLHDDKVTLYTCGPTVYNYLHVGNWAAYIYWDILVRTLISEGYNVERVMNITDVGHLVNDDEDTGEDKLQKGARREGKTAWEVAEFYAEDFLEGMAKLGMIMPEHIVRATDFISQQLDLIRILKDKGYTYQIGDGIYFDTSKFPTYADFADLDLAAQKAGARVEFNPEKRNASDFALWKFSGDEKRDMEWETPVDLLDEQRVTPGGAAPNSASVITRELGADQDGAPAKPASWGVSTGPASKETPIMGFPGWHLECSAMAMSILGPTIDIHTGGIDHIPVHHTNEIAQSESASGQKFADYWLHNNHLKVDGTKISKSLGNGYTLQDLNERGFSPLDYRMFILQGQYSNEGNFTFENLQAAKNRLAHWRNVVALRHQTHDTLKGDKEKSTDDTSMSFLATIGAVKEALADNLNTPEALRIIDEAFSKLEVSSPDAVDQDSLKQLITAIDELLGLQLESSTPDIADDVKQLIVERERARDDKNWQESDRLRDEIAKSRISVRDTKHGTVWEYV